MKKYIFFLFFIFLCAKIILAQTSSNNWIDYSTAHKYYKFAIHQDGVYALDSSTLANAGFPLNSINPQKIQLFARGAEIPIHITGFTDGVFNTNDRLEFYATKNRGELDTALYITKGGNPEYSLFNDTIYYFLTWSIGATNGLRYETDSLKIKPSVIENFWMQKTSFVFGNNYYGGSTSDRATNYGYYAEEGFMSFATTNTSNAGIDLNFTVSNLVSTQNCFINTVFITSDNYSGIGFDQNPKITLNGITIYDTLCDGYKYFNKTFSTSSVNLSLSNQLVYKSVNVGTLNSGRLAIAYAQIYSPRATLAQNKSNYTFFLKNGSGNKSLAITNQGGNKTKTQFLNLKTNKIITPLLLNDTIYITVNSTNDLTQNFISYNIDSTNNIKNIVKVNGTGFFKNYDISLATNKMIVLSHTKLMVAAVDYANYKTNKGLASVAVDINDLYDQFSFGIPKHSLVITNFAKHAKNVSTSNNSLFLLGKSITSASARNGSNYNQNLVPTYGYPPSDILLTANKFANNTAAPLLHTGRLAAQTTTDVYNYLSKATNYETNTSNPVKFTDGGEWMKKILHFAGGYSSFEADQLRGFLDDYKKIIEDTLYGGIVKTYSKNTDSPIGAVSDTVKNDINNGVSIMTFFGHASGAGFDQDIDKPSVYNNTNGKYPMIIGNSCYAGDIHNPSTPTTYGISEDWILNTKGAIGFLAESSLGYRYELSEYTSEFYRNITYKNYGKTIGECITKTINLLGNTPNQILTNTCVGMQYHGDPSIVLNSPALPDLCLRNTEVILPTVITTSQDSFNINITAFNLGKAVKTRVSLSIEHYYENETEPDTIYEKIFPNGITYKENIIAGIRLKPNKSLGLNTFILKIDPLNTTSPEILENNNAITINVNIANSDVYPIWPSNFDIVSSNKIVLKAATGNIFEAEASYNFECDTTDLFNSPLKQTKIITSKGGVISWNINDITLQDTMVYFWRIAKVTGNLPKWKESSFEYIPQKEGYAQANYFQFKNNTFDLIDCNKPQRKFDFKSQPVKLICTTFGSASTFQQFTETRYQLDTDIKEAGGCYGTPQIQVIVIDSNTIKPWGTKLGTENPLNSFGNYNDNGNGCRNPARVERVFSYFTTDSNQMSGVINLLNAVPNGFHVLIYTVKFGLFSNWPAVLKTYLLNMGAANINNLPDNYPYIFYARKGNVNSAIEKLAFSATEKLVLNTPLFNNWYKGEITTEPIGPASYWSNITWKYNSLENTNVDDITLQVITKNNFGADSILVKNIPATQNNYSLVGINATKFPFLQLRALVKDSINRTPPQLKNWRIYYTPLPEALVDNTAGYNFNTSTINEGDSLKLTFAVSNVTNKPMDSLLIRYWLQDNNSNIKNPISNALGSYAYLRYSPLLDNKTNVYTANFSSIGKTGDNNLWVEINPNNDQPEKFHYNNYLTVPFSVKTEKINPLLDITFDGVHILNGDIVSPSPEIAINIKDENKFLLINDTSNVSVSMKLESDKTYTTLTFGNQANYKMNFVPANNAKNEAQVTLSPNKLADGKYSLQVQSKDRSNNKSGFAPMQIEFEVIGKSSITQVLNYPNPFSTNTKFVFTLTGEQIPEVFNIEIMTITGKVVRNLSLTDLGLVKIGRNISSNGWDGKDNYGDQLANGLYLYRIIAKINGEEITLRNTNADNYFKKGWGKMYLMR